MSLKQLIVALLLFPVHAHGALSSNASINTNDNEHCNYQNNDACLIDPLVSESSSACSAPRGIEEPERDDQEVLGEDAYGMPQLRDDTYQNEIELTISDMKSYFRDLRNNANTTENMLHLLDNCKNKHENCAFWKVVGECEKNPGYMKVNCAPVCQSCHMLSVETRCPVDPDAPIAWKPGDVHRFFSDFTSNPEVQKYEPRVLARPNYADGDNEETADYQLGPWVVILDNFITDEEANRLIELGALEGYERSSDVGKMRFDGTFENNVNNGRTSENAWCQNACYNDTVAQQVIHRIAQVTNIPEENSEYLQLLRYEKGQYYQTHHDLIGHQLNRQPGVRIMTFYMYLNDVEEGGGTQFPKLGPLTVQPKKGRALIWPSVLDENPDMMDNRMDHQALPVIKGVKYGANAWIHQRDFKGPNKNGCQ